METTPWMWIAFAAIILIMLALDLGIFHKKTHEVKTKEAFLWTITWIGLALLFNVGIYFYKGPTAAMEFLSGYLIEKALSIDNIFVFILIFSTLKIPGKFQHKILFWGIVGALLMRALFIAAGISLIQKFEWVIYLFGAFLIYTGVHIFRAKDKNEEEKDPTKNRLFRFLFKVIPTKHSIVSDKFFVKEDGRVWATPLFTTLVLIEISDLIFAVDSIPAILAITTDIFIVYTSNIFAILGLRSLYFLVNQIMDKFYYLTHGLSFILCFVGFKMVISHFYKIPVIVSLSVIIGTIALSILSSSGKGNKRA